MPVSGAMFLSKFRKAIGLDGGAMKPVHAGRRQTDWLCQSVLRKAKKFLRPGAGCCRLIAVMWLPAGRAVGSNS